MITRPKIISIMVVTSLRAQCRGSVMWYNREYARKMYRTHGLSNTLTWKRWYTMRRRCRNDERYANITHCEAWSDYLTFLADVGECPSEKHTLDRYPNKEGNYEPGNVRWATPLQQSRNRTNQVELTYNGRTQCMAAWANELGIHLTTLYARVERWGIEKALTTPKDEYMDRHKKGSRRTTNETS